MTAPPTDEAPIDSDFSGLWLEILTDRRSELGLGSGTLNVQLNSPAVTINTDSLWSAGPRDLGRELFIAGDRYVISAVGGPTQITLDRPFEGANDPTASYATGSVPYGPSWLANVPTSLVMLNDNRADLATIP